MERNVSPRICKSRPAPTPLDIRPIWPAGELLNDEKCKATLRLTAVPPHALTQRDAAAAAHKGFASRYDDFERLARVFENSGIRQRFTVRPLEWYLEPLGWPERNAAYLEGAAELFFDAAKGALDGAGVRAADVDTVVTVSSTGIATPSLEARVAGRIGFRPDVERVPVFGLGCAGGVSGLSIGARLAQSRPGSLVLVVAVELCTLAFRLDKLTKENIVATALFGDGAAACVLRSGETGIASVEMSGQHTWPDTLDIMGWDVDAEGFGVIFDRAIPPFAQANIAPAVVRHPRPGRAGPRRHRSLRLPPGRRQGHRGPGARAVARTGLARSRAQRARRLWQHVGADGALRARAADRGRTAVAHAADRDGAGLHRELRFPEERRVTPAAVLLALVTVERLAELWLARRNTAALLAKGAVEVAAGHYPLIVAAACCSGCPGLWIFGWARPVSLPWLAVFLVLQLLRVWVLLTLGRRWTTRIIVLPGAPLVASGPYRYVSHPNYLVVVGEIAVLPLCLGLPWFALLFSAANAARPGDPHSRRERGPRRSARWSRLLTPTTERPVAAATWIGFGAMCVGMFMAILDVQIVATSLPTIQSALGIAPDQMSWVQTAYLIAEVIAIPLTGFLMRVLSMRWLFVSSVTLFTLASIGCAASGQLPDAGRLAGAAGLFRRNADPGGVRRRLPALSGTAPGPRDDDRRRHGGSRRRPPDRSPAAGSPRPSPGTGCS